VDNDLAAKAREAVEEHLEHCYSCHEELHEIVAVLDTCREAIRHPIPCDNYEALRRRLRALPFLGMPGSFRPGRLVRKAAAVVGLAAAAVILVSIAQPIVQTTQCLVVYAEQAAQPDYTEAEMEDVGKPVPLLLAWYARVVQTERAPDREIEVRKAAREASRSHAEGSSRSDTSGPVSQRAPNRGRMVLAYGGDLAASVHGWV
jgi:hypothetical protein